MNNLYRSQTNAMLGGVCGGLGQYLKIDPTLVRLIFVLLFFSGFGLVAYLLFWVLVPREDRSGLSPAETARAGADEIAARARALADSARSRSMDSSPAAIVVGGLLIGLGGLLLLRNLQLPWFAWLNKHTFWPLVMVALGIVFLVKK
ncbi:MAG: PspC domain-containing protein [Bacteroidota bacterium]